MKDSSQFDLFKNPYFLKLLCDQIDALHIMPKGRASLFTGFVRKLLERDKDRLPELKDNELLNLQDRRKLSQNRWHDNFELPDQGPLLPSLAKLAFSLQQSNSNTESRLIRISRGKAISQIGNENAERILKAGIGLNILDEDIGQNEITFFHHLLQEFFAAQHLSKKPNAELLHVDWHIDKVSPNLTDVIAGLSEQEPLPPIPQTPWIETALIAAPIVADQNAFIRELMNDNLPLAGRCAASPEVEIDPELNSEIQNLLIARSQDSNADLRARIAAGLALGEIGDPRFEHRTGFYGDYLLPPMIEIEGGQYPIFENVKNYSDGHYREQIGKIEVKSFQIGQFPVTNAEYAKFVHSGGYRAREWWDDAEMWLNGSLTSRSQHDFWRGYREAILEFPSEFVEKTARGLQYNPEKIIKASTLSYTEFEAWLQERFPLDQPIIQPDYWDDIRFNNPVQPIIGISWYEANAYCKWLTAQAGHKYELLTEAQFEAAAYGKEGRQYSYGNAFDATRGNSYETHIRRTTPVGIFNNATPEGVYDLTSNAYTWTTQVLRGGSWSAYGLAMNSAFHSYLPGARGYYSGLRLCRNEPVGD